MSQLTIKLSDKADALIAQLQKEIFNRRRKKVSAAGVVETLVESGAKSQSDKRFATARPRRTVKKKVVATKKPASRRTRTRSSAAVAVASTPVSSNGKAPVTAG